MVQTCEVHTRNNLRFFLIAFALLLPTACLFGCSTMAGITTAIDAPGPGAPVPVQPMASGPISPLYFGLAIHNDVHWPSVSFGSHRLWDCGPTWAQIEPQRGNFVWWILDMEIEDMETRNPAGDTILELGQTPTWASIYPTMQSPDGLGAAGPPADNLYWQEYVTAVVTRYKGRIHAYEIWNEPFTTVFWAGTESQLVELTREAYNIIHSIDPSALVLSPSNNLQWMSGFLAAGGGNYVDVIATHIGSYPHAPEAIAVSIQKMKGIMSEYGVQNKPLWNTEFEYVEPDYFATDQDAAAWLARVYIVDWWFGIERSYFYAWDDLNMTLQTVDSNFKANSAGIAYGVVFNWLAGATMTNCRNDASGTWICSLERNDQPFWIVWNVNGATTVPRTIAPGATSEQDLTGATSGIGVNSTIAIGESPMLLQ